MMLYNIVITQSTQNSDSTFLSTYLTVRMHYFGIV